MYLILVIVITACFPGLLWAHGDDGQETGEGGAKATVQLAQDEPSTWEQIQRTILNRQCTTCHLTGSSFARQSGLVLQEDVAYEQLVEAAPRNAAAAADGLVRVSSRGGLPGLLRSFLWEKINAEEQDHFYSDHPHYGALMPLGQPSLTRGELELIRQWIEAGAPALGVVAAAALLQDTSRYTAPEFVVLEPPEEGIQLHLGPFEVWATDDREFLYYEPLTTAEDLYVKGYEISMRPGSHHFIAYNYPEGGEVPVPQQYRDIRNAQGKHDFAVVVEVNELFPQRFFIGTQTPYVNYRFPPGVALRLPAGSGFDLNAHYVRSDQVETGEVYANIYTVERDQVEVVAEPGNFNNLSIELPPGEITTLRRKFFFEETRHIIQMWSHAHEHMLEFSIQAVGGERDGELLYWTNDWEHPPLLELDPPLTMGAEEGLELITTYNNWTDETIRFGFRGSDEMQFVFFISYSGDYVRPSTAVLEESEPALPQRFVLQPNYPNPFNGTTVIRYTLPQSGPVELAVYNLAGQKVAVLAEGLRQAGAHAADWDGRDGRGRALASGVYVYRLRAGGQKETRKLLLLR
jgi:hypothetical protein